MDTDIKMEIGDTNEDTVIINNGIPEKAAMEEEKKNNINQSIQNQAAQNNGPKANKQECFQCKICPYNTVRRPFLDKHMQHKHGFSKVTVDNKGKSSFHEKSSIKIIRNNGNISQIEDDGNCYDNDEYGCSLCDFKTRHLNLLNIHQEIHEDKQKEVYQCTQCDFNTEEVTALRDHEETHKKLILFCCEKCDYATRQKCNLKQHMKIHEDPEKVERFTCTTCRKFVSLNCRALSRHIKKKHGSDGKIFKCDKCPFKGKIQKHVTNHQKMHAGNDDAPMFKCEKCDFVTYKEQTIQKHVQRHEEREKDGEEVIVKEKNEENEIIWFCCNKCDFRSKEQRYVILHKKVHIRIDEINKIGESLVQSEKMENSREEGNS